MIDSPETMSMNSDICSHHMDSGLEDDDDLSVTHGEMNGEHASRFQRKKEDFSFENTLLSVAAKARKFADGRQKSKRKFKLSSFRNLLADAETGDTRAADSRSQDYENDDKNEDTINVMIEGPSTGELGGKADSSASEMSPGVLRKNEGLVVPAADAVVDMSDDNESKWDDDTLDTNAR
jgi:hypothetical protein